MKIREAATRMNDVLDKARKDGRGGIAFQMEDYKALCALVQIVAEFFETVGGWEIKKDEGDHTAQRAE